MAAAALNTADGTAAATTLAFRAYMRLVQHGERPDQPRLALLNDLQRSTQEDSADVDSGVHEYIH